MELKTENLKALNNQRLYDCINNFKQNRYITTVYRQESKMSEVSSFDLSLLYLSQLFEDIENGSMNLIYSIGNVYNCLGRKSKNVLLIFFFSLFFFFFFEEKILTRWYVWGRGKAASSSRTTTASWLWSLTETKRERGINFDVGINI